MTPHSTCCDAVLREALEVRGHRFTDQRAAVYRFLSHTTVHPTADEVFLEVRSTVPGISLATVYKSLEALVTCGLAIKLSHADGSARYDGRTDPHHHARCLACGRVTDVPSRFDESELARVQAETHGFRVTGYQLELTGYCPGCVPSVDTVAPTVLA